ncbi:aldehyde dehydrogenase family protein [Desulfovibrio sp. AM18-2]|uniref:Aldehyde dehydrogenase family protein n=2 Tax=Desulfovibrio legallii TaxID=571438 RepID=A0A6H3F8M5_9BACT|nr:aldehyde dehydrogenase family protein [Desulfovibrio legallii]RHH26155.1 aldehyde dehydrogenase family protein [Desulfovibrio sp. AM18-2]TBH81910.1 aldehyde dehydrogenase family protein [Desulfovibrio legallii]
MIGDKDLISMQQARILAENAAAAQKKLAAMPQEALDAMVETMADAVEAQAQSLAVMSQEESDCGVWQDKLVKILFVCRRVRQSLRGLRCVGPLREDPASGIQEVGVPLGVIAALCPVTSPISTAICNALLAIKSGNAIVFSLHPRALESMRTALDVLCAAGRAQGMPEGAVSYMDIVAKSGTQELMRHPDVALVLVTGVLGMFPTARASGKPLIYGGTGNGPAFIERSARLETAVADILASKAFDNGLAPSAEQCVIVDGCVEPRVRRAFQDRGGYFMSPEEADAVIAVLFHADGRRRRHMVGQSAQALAQKAGFVPPQDTRVLLAPRLYVAGADPYTRELLTPVLGYYVEPDWRHACEKCLELLLQERHAQTLTIHSQDAEVIRQFALKKPVARLLVNTGAAFGGMGLTTNLTPAMTQGSGIAGYGITSDNISPYNLIYRRTVGYGVRGLDCLADFAAPQSANPAPPTQEDPLELLRAVLRRALETAPAPRGRTRP